jgi:hypothetical protein
MRAILFATAFLSLLGFAQGAIASCTTVEHVAPSANRAEHVMKAGDCLWTTDTRYVLFMHPDGSLDLTDRRYPGHPILWHADVGTPQPGSTAVLKNDGSFVVKDPAGKELWRANAHISSGSPAESNYFISIAKKGRVEMYKGTSSNDPNRALVWQSEDNQASDRDGVCQCHIVNTDGSPGKASAEAFGTCGLTTCRSTCAAKKDYFGDALIGTYKNGSGKCKAF